MRIIFGRSGALVVAVFLAGWVAPGCGPAQPSDSGMPTTEGDAPTGEGLSGSIPVGTQLKATGDVNLRSSPSTSSSVVHVVSAGSTVTVVSSDPQNGFYNIKHSGSVGWSSGKYYEPVATPPSGIGTGAVLTATGDVNLRNGPSVNDSILDVVTAGSDVTTVDGTIQNGYYHVDYNGTVGYSSSKYYKITSSGTGGSGGGGGNGGTSGAGGSGAVGGGGGAPTASELLALLTSCKQVSSGLYRKDASGSSTIPICSLTGAYFWKADMDIDCDGVTTSQCNSSTDGSFQNSTSGSDSSGNPLNAAQLPYVVVPLASTRWDYKAAGIHMGSVVAVIYNGQVSYGVVGDLGPSSVIGEASYAMAKSLGINPNPSTGGVDSGVSYIVFSGSSAVVSHLEDHAAAANLGQSLAAQLLQNN